MVAFAALAGIMMLTMMLKIQTSESSPSDYQADTRY